MQVDLLVHLHSWPVPYGIPALSVSALLAPSPWWALHSVFVPSVHEPVRSIPQCQLLATLSRLTDASSQKGARGQACLSKLPSLSKILAFLHRCGSSLKEALKQIQSILFSLCSCPLPETWFKPPALPLLGTIFCCTVER